MLGAGYVMPQKSLQRMAAAGLLALAWGCSGGGGGPEAPSITAQPASVTVNGGERASFSVTAKGATPLAYQWRKDGTAIPGATWTSYALTAAALTDAGSYDVVVTNNVGKATSQAAVLTVRAVAPALGSQPQAVTVFEGQPASFSVTATGTAPLTYQWKKDGTAVPGATSATLAFTSAATTDAGTYTVTVTNTAGSVTSQGAALTVNASAPSFTTMPADQQVVAGGSVTLTAAATGSLPITYQWYKGGNPIAGATGTSLVFNPVALTDAGIYTVRATNTHGNALSSAATLTVDAAPLLDFTIDGMHVTQSTQTYGGTVPLVAGKNGLLRVFVKASIANTAQPKVRVRWYDGTGTLVQTWTITAPGTSVPTTVSTTPLSASWNVAVPGTLLQSGASVLADVDPDGTYTETSKSNNTFPASGTPQALSVTDVPTFATTIVPVLQNNLRPSLTTRDLPSWTGRLALMGPLGTVDAQLGELYTTTVVLGSDGSGWSSLLSEIEAKRLADGAGGRYYYGAVAVGYTSGTAGLGYVPGSPSGNYRSAIGWNKTGYQDGGNFPEVFAHEVGHNLGRYHAPCGSPANVDGSYPYAGAVIGVAGYNTTYAVLEDPSIKDIMSYCYPVWISDYTYTGIFNWRQAGAAAAVVQDAPQQEGLLVWGRRQGGKWILEPAFRIKGPLPAGGGAHRASAVDGSGQEIAGVDFDMAAVGCGTDPDEAHFAVFLPMGGDAFDRIQTLQVKAGDQILALRKPSLVLGGDAALNAQPAGGTTLRWTSGHPAALVRDARTGEVVAIARDGVVNLPEAREVDVQLSDGVHTEKVRLTPEP